jgi:arsenate reductase
MMIVLCHPKCSTCKKALGYLRSNGIAYESRDIVTHPPTVDELSAWQARSGLPLRRFFNTSGQKYRALSLSERVKTMDAQQMLEILASDGMLVKRPLVVTPERVLVGFREKEWAALIP